MNNLLDVVTKGITVFFLFFFLRQIDKLYKIFVKQVVLDDELEDRCKGSELKRLNKIDKP